MKHIGLGENRYQAFRDVAHQVDADEIIESENAGLRDAKWTAKYGVGLLRLQPHFEGGMQCRLDREHTNAVAKKSGCVIAKNNALAHARLIEMLEAVVGLETEFVGQLILEISGAEPSQNLVQAIYGHTEGNPFFMTEIIRLLGERRLSGGDPFEDEGLGELEIPHGVLEVVGQRLNRLSAECESALTTAAVIGRQFDFRVLGLLDGEISETQMLEAME